MANKYLRHGETFCGDGTTADAAASDGGVGSWNNINVVTGTAPDYGTLAAGDTVYIRSKDAAGADIDQSISAGTYIGSSSATLSNPISWIVDGGTVWSGISGVYRIIGSQNAHQMLARSYNLYVSEVQDAWVLRNTSTTSNTLFFLESSVFCQFTRLLFDVSSATSYVIVECQSQSRAVFISCSFLSSATASVRLFVYGNGVLVHLIAPRIVLNNTVTYVFMKPPVGVRLKVMGGSVSGSGATTGTAIAQADDSYGLREFVGLQYPSTVALVAGSYNDAWPIGVSSVGADGGIGSVVSELWGYASSRSDGYFPTLNAVLPDSVATPWSWLVVPNNVLYANPWSLDFGKFFTATAAALTITVELLLESTAFAALHTTENTYIVVSYIDHTTGATYSLTSCAPVGAALTTSTAPWSATTYGAISLAKHKLTVTTPTTVKQNTMVFIRVSGGVKQLSANSLIFVCPDAQLE